MNSANIPISTPNGRRTRWSASRGTQSNTQSSENMISRHGNNRHRPYSPSYGRSQRASRNRPQSPSDITVRNWPPDAPWPGATTRSMENMPPNRSRPMERDNHYRRPSALNADHDGTNRLISPYSQLCSLIVQLCREDMIPVPIKGDLDQTLRQVRWISCQIDCLMGMSIVNRARAELYFISLDHLSHQYEAFRLVRKALTYREPDGQLLHHNHSHEDGICPHLRALHAYLTAFRTENQPTSIVSSTLRYRPDNPLAELDGPLHVQARMLNLRCVAESLDDDSGGIESADELARMVARLAAYTIDDDEWEEASSTIKMIREAWQLRRLDERLRTGQSDASGEISNHQGSSDNADTTPLQDITHHNLSVPMTHQHRRRQHHSELLPAEPFYSQYQPFTIERRPPYPSSRQERFSNNDYGTLEEQSTWTINVAAISNRAARAASNIPAHPNFGSNDNAAVRQLQERYDAAMGRHDSFVDPADIIELNRGTEPLSPMSIPRERAWDAARAASSRHRRSERLRRPRNMPVGGFWSVNSWRRNNNATDTFHATPGHGRLRSNTVSLGRLVRHRPYPPHRTSSTSSESTVRARQSLSVAESRYVNAWTASNRAARVGVSVHERRRLESEMQEAMDNIGAVPGVARFEWEERAKALRRRA